MGQKQKADVHWQPMKIRTLDGHNEQKGHGKQCDIGKGNNEHGLNFSLQTDTAHDISPIAFWPDRGLEGVMSN